ncbi:MAG: helix-turn-helix domain-containing protein [Candidatus Binataceae bacterium]
MKKNPVKATPEPEAEIMEVQTLAEFLRCDKSTIYRLLKNKKIPAFKLGSDYRFIKADIIRWIQKSAVRPKS